MDIVSNMMVSVIVPTFKRPKEMLSRAIESLINQSYSKIEIVVVDDNAKPELEQFREDVKNLIKLFKDKRIKLVLNEKNLGSAGSRNHGIEQASGEYVTFLDDDDVYLPQKIELQLKNMIDNGSDYSISDLSLFYTDETLAECRTREYIKKTDSESLLKYHIMYVLAGTDSMMFKKEYLQKIGGFDKEDFGDDFFLFKRAIDGKGIFSYCPGSQIKAYVHKSEEGISIGKTKIDGENSIYNYKKQFFKILNLKERRYVKMRHYAVLAYAYKRQKRNLKFLANGLHAMLVAPIQGMKLLLNLKKTN